MITSFGSSMKWFNWIWQPWVMIINAFCESSIKWFHEIRQSWVMIIDTFCERSMKWFREIRQPWVMIMNSSCERSMKWFCEIRQPFVMITSWERSINGPVKLGNHGLCSRILPVKGIGMKLYLNSRHPLNKNEFSILSLEGNMKWIRRFINMRGAILTNLTLKGSKSCSKGSRRLEV